MTKMRKVYFIAPVASMRRRTRLAKFENVASSSGLEVIFYGWTRTGEEKLENNQRQKKRGNTEKTILHGGGYGGLLNKFMYLLWCLSVFVTVLRIPRKQVLFCLGLETAFPALLACFFTRSIVIFDDADRLSMLQKLPFGVRQFIVALEEYTSKKSSIHLVPGHARYQVIHPKMLVLQNTPTSQDLLESETIHHQRPNCDLVVYVNGWLTKTRGIPIFNEALDILKTRGVSVKMIVAGHSNSEEGRKLINHPLVEYYGPLKQKEALAVYRIADLVLTYYDPSIEINRYAESNKWGDCIQTNTPFIVNEEVETAKIFVQSSCAQSLPYNSPEALADLLTDLIKFPDRILAMKSSISVFSKKFPTFDLQVEKIFDRFYGETLQSKPSQITKSV